MTRFELLVVCPTGPITVDVQAHVKPGDSDYEPDEKVATLPDLLDEGWAVVAAYGGTKVTLILQRPHRARSGSLADAWG